MLPTEALPTVEGLVGSLLRETSDTANTVGQEAQRWLDAIKGEIRRLDPAADVRIVAVDLDANADYINIHATAIARLLGAVFRNGDAEVNYFRLSYANTTDMNTTTSGAVVSALPVAARAAANQPSYGFMYWPGGFDATMVAAGIINDGLSVYATDNNNLAVAGTGIADGSCTAVYTV